MKWTLVARGKAEPEAETSIQEINWLMGIAIGLIGVTLIAVKRWLAGLVSLVLSLTIIGVAAGKIR